MVLVSNPRQLFHKQYGRGIGHYYKDMYGQSIFLNSLKNLGRILLRGSKSLYKIVKPKAVTFAKDTFNEFKPKIQKVATEASSKWINNLINQPSKIKESSREAVNDFIKNTKQAVNETLPSIKERSEKSIHEIINGGSMKRGKPKQLSRSSKSILRSLIKM